LCDVKDEDLLMIHCKCGAQAHSGCTVMSGEKYWCDNCVKDAMPRVDGGSGAAIMLLVNQVKEEREKVLELSIENTKLKCKNESLEAKIVELQQKIDKNEHCLQSDEKSQTTAIDGSTGSKPKTYAKTAATDKQSLILKPKEGKFDHVKDMQASILKENMNLKLTKLVDDPKKQQFEYQCASNEERDALKTSLQNNKALMRNVDELSEKVKPTELRKLKVYNLMSGEYEDEDLFFNAVISKNELDDSKPDFKLRCSYIGRKKSNGNYDMIMEMDDATYSQLTKYSTMYTPWGEHRIEEYIRVRVCKKCQCYGHTEWLCTASTVCSYCAGNHKYEECNAVEKKCANCEKFNRRNPDEVVDMYHAAYEKCCPTYVYVREKIVKQMQQ